MMLEAVWFKNGEEVYKVAPVTNILCYENMENISEIEINDRERWHAYEDVKCEADDFVIRIKKNDDEV